MYWQLLCRVLLFQLPCRALLLMLLHCLAIMSAGMYCHTSQIYLGRIWARRVWGRRKGVEVCVGAKFSLSRPLPPPALSERPAFIRLS